MLQESGENETHCTFVLQLLLLLLLLPPLLLLVWLILVLACRQRTNCPVVAHGVPVATAGNEIAER